MMTKSGEQIIKKKDNRQKSVTANRINFGENAIQFISLVIWFVGVFELFFFGVFLMQTCQAHIYSTHLDYIIIRRINANLQKCYEVATAKTMDKTKMWQ